MIGELLGVGSQVVMRERVMVADAGDVDGMRLGHTARDERIESKS